MQDLLIEVIRKREEHQKMLNKSRSGSMKGENNPRWNGGNSKYPNHAELKRIRIEILKKSKGKCEICGKIATTVHHIDEDKSNHNIDNLIPVCLKCHMTLHCEDEGKLSGRGDAKGRGRPRGVPSLKYKLAYNMTLREIGEKLGVTGATIAYWLKSSDKEKWLKEQLKNRTYK